jgi:hypothetical protein
MEVPVGATMGALRIGIQIISTSKRPLIEVYQRTHNVLGPEEELGDPRSAAGVVKTRFSDHYISFTAVNLGVRRAEDVTFRIKDGLKRDGHPFGELFETTVPYLAPGQALPLLRLEESDLLKYIWKEGPGGHRSGLPDGFKPERLKIAVEYNGPWAGFGRMTRAWAAMCRRKQYRSRYEFEPRSVGTDYPPVEMLG